MNKNIAISVNNIHKTFRLPHDQHSGVKQYILNLFRRNRVKGYENQHVLKGINFEIKKGEFFGIVGRNGSGKSTLLKLLAGIYVPDKGSIVVNGTLVPFIELGVGFNPELTGRENVYLNGALLGFSRNQMDEMYDEIVEFAELKKFMDQKLKNYSSGMQVRLAFSIAIRAETDILVLDEVLAVGDEAFQRKCSDYFSKIRDDKNKTVILVTHDMASVKKYCDRAVLIKNGEIVLEGSPLDVANEYTLINFDAASTTTNDDKKNDIYALAIKPISERVLKSGNDMTVEILYKLDKESDLEMLFPSVALYINNTPIVFDTIRDKGVKNKIGINKVKYSYPTKDISEGSEIKVVAELWQRGRNRDDDTEAAFIDTKDAAIFKISSSKESPNGDIFRTRGEWGYDS
ncbi:MAG TPA: ABC transporter ATP-binding protein [Candidatus Saccharimonadales bacterium]